MSIFFFLAHTWNCWKMNKSRIDVWFSLFDTCSFVDFLQDPLGVPKEGAHPSLVFFKQYLILFVEAGKYVQICWQGICLLLMQIWHLFKSWSIYYNLRIFILSHIVWLNFNYIDIWSSKFKNIYFIKFFKLKLYLIIFF